MLKNDVAKELSEYINTWLESLKTEDRVLFVRRYWYGEEVRELAKGLDQIEDEAAGIKRAEQEMDQLKNQVL